MGLKLCIRKGGRRDARVEVRVVEVVVRCFKYNPQLHSNWFQAFELYNQSQGNQQLLPLESIFKKNIVFHKLVSFHETLQ